ncbi:MAG: serine hydrolase domain-containing protein [Candidatus Dormibacteria bacterium]
MAATRTAFENEADIKAYVTGLADAGKLSGAVLVSRGEHVFRQAFGLADRTTGAPNTTSTIFRIGSNTKQFTAEAILILANRHRLQLSDSICDHLRDCPPAWQRVTLRQLLDHTSGMPDYVNGELNTYWTHPQTPDQLLGHFRDQPLDFPPGTRFKYSSSGYVLLGMVIEKVAGEPYAQFLRHSVLGPLHLDRTGVDSVSPPVPEHALGYYADGTQPERYDPSVAYAAGALYSTVDDLDTWDRAIASRRLGGGRLEEEMVTVQAPCPPAGSRRGCDLPTDVGYGYGWEIADEPTGRLVYHLGRIDGFVSMNGFYPQSGTDVVVLSNSEATDFVAVGRVLGAMANR